MDYYQKYLKYKNKYITLKNSIDGGVCFSSLCKLKEKLKAVGFNEKIGRAHV